MRAIEQRRMKQMRMKQMSHPWRIVRNSCTWGEHAKQNGHAMEPKTSQIGMPILGLGRLWQLEVGIIKKIIPFLHIVLHIHDSSSMHGDLLGTLSCLSPGGRRI